MNITEPMVRDTAKVVRDLYEECDESNYDVVDIMSFLLGVFHAGGNIDSVHEVSDAELAALFRVVNEELRPDMLVIIGPIPVGNGSMVGIRSTANLERTNLLEALEKANRSA